NINFSRNSPYGNNFSSNSTSQYVVYDIKKRSNGTIYLATAGGVWKSINNGVSYTQSYNGLPQTGTVITVYQVNDLFISGTFPNDTLFAATDNGIYFSTNDAQSFTLCAGTNGAKMQQFLKYDNVLYCAGTKIYKRTSPNNWTQFTTFTNTGILGFAATDGYLFVSVANSPLKYAPINGLSNFTNIVTGTGNFAYSVAAYDTLVFYFSNNGVFKLNTTLLGNATQSDLLQIADNLPYYNNPGNIRQYKYLDNGFGMSIFNGKLWLGTKGMSTFYRSLADFGYDITVGEKAPNNEKIKSSGVVFPNPTKDKLTITDLAQGSQLTIYNSIGQLVVQLSNSQSQTIDISKLEKGIYTYSIITDNKQNEISSGKFIKE
ncbi:MAG: T9SS type A sorting domain-containing protein, partial [Bacteroidota bacterium]